MTDDVLSDGAVADDDLVAAGYGRADGWSPPMPLTASRALPAFPVDSLPSWLADHVRAVAEFTQTPTDLAGCVALADLAAAAGGRVVVEVRGSWREPTNLFVVVSMPPGSRKSAVFAEMTRPLLAAEQHLAEQAGPEIRRATTEREVAQRSAQEARAKASRADDGERDALLDEAVARAQLAEAVTVPVMPRLIADDITPEAATSLLAEQGGRLAVLSAEGGIFSILGGRYTSGTPSFEVFLKGHAGDMLRVDRKGRPPEHIPNPALTLGLAVQPDVLRSIARVPGFRGRGLLARILFAVPPNNVGSRRIGTDPVPAPIADAFDANLRSLVMTLAEWTDPAVLVLGPSAAARLLRAEEQLEPLLAPGAALGHVADWAAKLVGATARIAGLLHLATHLRDGWARSISGDTMADAIALAAYFGDHALAAFGEMGADETTDNARAVLAWLRDRGLATFTKRDVHRAHQARFREAADVDPVLERLEDLGWVRRREDSDRGPKGGRPASPTYYVNPLTEPTQLTEPGCVGSVSCVIRNLDGDRCAACGVEVERYDPDGTPWCERHARPGMRP